MTRPKPPKPEGKPKGTLIKTKSGLWQGIVTLPDGRRKRLTPFPKGMSEAMAREKTAYYAERPDEIGDVKRARIEAKGPTIETEMDRWVQLWIADKTARGQTSTRDAATHYRLHIRTVLSSHVKAWTRDDLRRLSHTLDLKVQGSKLSAKTAQNVWNTATKIADDATESKRADLRCRDENPALKVRGPERGDHKSKQLVFPSEFQKFVACETVPLHWRQAITLAIYTYARDAELRTLTVGDIDLEHGNISISKALNRRTGATKATKGRRHRSVPIELALRPLLEALTRGRDKAEPLIVLPSTGGLASGLKRWLAEAKVDRPELLTGTPTTRPIRWHDLRATGVSWMAVRGDDALKIQQRAGHTDFATTQGYVRLAEAISEDFGLPFPELPESLLERAAGPDRNTGSLQRGVSNRNHSEFRVSDGDRNRQTSINHAESESSDRFGSDDLTEPCDASAGSLAGCDDESLLRSPPASGPRSGIDPISAAIATALERASAAGEWGAVVALAAELAARRRDPIG